MIYTPLLDRFPGDLSYCLHLLIGLDRVKVDQGGRLIAMGGEGPLVIVKVDPIQPKKAFAQYGYGTRQTRLLLPSKKA